MRRSPRTDRRIAQAVIAFPLVGWSFALICGFIFEMGFEVQGLWLRSENGTVVCVVPFFSAEDVDDEEFSF
jgi:hypothetical protein